MKKLLLLIVLLPPFLKADVIPIVNSHPIIAAHFNPIMEGVSARKTVIISETSFFEEGNFGDDENYYEYELDLEVTAISFFHKLKRDNYNLSYCFTFGVLHAGFFDDTINDFHDLVGLDGPSYQAKKVAPMNQFRFHVEDINRSESFSIKENSPFLDLETFLSRDINENILIRTGVRYVPINAGLSSIPTEPEFMIGAQYHQHKPEWLFVADASLITTKPGEQSDFKVRRLRSTLNLFFEYQKAHLVINYADSPYYSNSGLDGTHGCILALGYRMGNIRFGIVEDITSGSIAQDVSIYLAYQF